MYKGHAGKLILYNKDQEVITVGTKINQNLYKFSFESTMKDNSSESIYAMTNQSLQSWEIWHRRFGHMGYCNRPGELDAPVSTGTSLNDFLCSFVLPLSTPCMISIGAASCSLAKASTSRYRCPLSCSLFCIGMTCGGPCSSPDY